jgi:hypothetical protein
MKKIKEFEEEFSKLVNLLKTKYAKRPAFLDEMKYIQNTKSRIYKTIFKRMITIIKKIPDWEIKIVYPTLISLKRILLPD